MQPCAPTNRISSGVYLSTCHHTCVPRFRRSVDTCIAPKKLLFPLQLLLLLATVAAVAASATTAAAAVVVVVVLNVGANVAVVCVDRERITSVVFLYLVGHRN